MASKSQSSSDNADVAKAPVSSRVAAGKKIAKIYLETILVRPYTCIGSIERQTQPLWVYENEEMVCRSVTFVPGLYRIFDEILVNAADNKQRDQSMDSIQVWIDAEHNEIIVYNNGAGVPVEIHQEEGVYVPEMMFGHLLNDANVKKTTGGRNGYGAKLTNIFSTEFIIETADGKRLKKYKQVFENNMSKKSEPVITKCDKSENWTKVTFKPDLKKFNMTELENDVVALMKKRVFDIAGCLGNTVQVELNGKRVPIKSFSDYVDLYLSAANKSRTDPLPRITEKVNDRWEVGVSLSDGQFQQVSFVNSIATIEGGYHVDYVTNQITDYIVGIVNKKNRNAIVKTHNVKNHLWVFVNAVIDNPAFTSQAKETLSLDLFNPSSFVWECELSEDILKKVAKSVVVENLLSWSTFKQNKDLKKIDGAKTGRVEIEKLVDANEAGGKNSQKCTLILTQGDSAKALALEGLSVVGRDNYGIFPLRGKLLNVRKASIHQIKKNKEIQNIKKILGLKEDMTYDNVDSLRYGHVMIMTDQDQDGSHIKGLLINFFHYYWPTLLKIPSFICGFITPIVKATHKKTKGELSFYSIPDYKCWEESLRGDAITEWKIKYYKGLDTITSKEGKEYFRNLDCHKKDFVWEGEQDGEAIELAFSKKKSEARKFWLLNYEPGTHLDQKKPKITYRDFVNKELILFFMADLQRSIPSMVDGLKPDQRKILFCAFKRNLVKEVKVAEFSGYVSEHSAYHHGEESLACTIINMAQDYVGTNNINLLQPKGQIGTRNLGGKDAGKARYISTKLSPATRVLFPRDDDVLLDYLNEDGQMIEPTWYMPIIPTVLVNGSEGIGTEWSTFIPSYNPREIVANIRRRLRGQKMKPMHPWYRCFKGTIKKTESKEGGCSTYTTTGLCTEVNDTTLRMELPIRKCTDDYRQFLISMKADNGVSFIKDVRAYNDDTSVGFDLILDEKNMLAARQEGFLKKFELTTTISTCNMHLFDKKGVIKRYATPEEILEEFFDLRLEYYKKRKEMLKNLELELLKLDNKVKFILGLVSGEIVVTNGNKADDELRQRGFTPFPKMAKPVEAAVAGATDGAEESEESSVAPAPSSPFIPGSDYDYLWAMAIGSLTIGKFQELHAQRDQMMKAVEDLKNATPTSLWLRDLKAFDMELDKLDQQDAQAEKERKVAQENIRADAETSKPISLDDDDDDGVVEVAPAKEGGRKPAASKAAKPPAAPRKRKQPVASTEVVAAIGVSPEKKVRKMRSSPFNKKSSSVMSRLANKEEESSENAAGNSSSEKSGDVFAAKSRPQRANRRTMTYVLSDSESESANESLSDSESESANESLSDSESESANESESDSESESANESEFDDIEDDEDDE